jgi:hypothetical protein
VVHGRLALSSATVLLIADMLLRAQRFASQMLVDALWRLVQGLERTMLAVAFIKLRALTTNG